MKIESLIEALESMAERAALAPSQWPADTATAAQHLAEAIRRAGAEELQQLRIARKADDIGSLLMKFAEVSQVTKQEWLKLAEMNGLSLDLNPRDSARDVMNKIGRYLRDHPEARVKLSAKSSQQTPSHKATKGKRKLAESLHETLTRLLDK